MYNQKIKERITLNDFYKFNQFRKESFNIIDYESIFKLLFVQKFTGVINLKLISKELKYNYYDSIRPKFDYVDNDKEDIYHFIIEPFIGKGKKLTYELWY